MATVHWTNKAGGSWQTGSNWSTGAPPAATDDVIINAVGTYTVTSTAAVTVNSLQTIATVTLDISNSTFTMTNGTGAGANAGTIIDDNSSVLFIGGTLNNTGTIRENSTGNTTDIRLSYPVVTLTGGGKLIMSNNANNRIFGEGSGYQLINVNNTISGAGQIGAGQLVLVNESKGVIDANQTTQIVLNTSGIVTNAGLIEATSTGGLLIQNTTVDNAGGTISASGTGSHIDLGGGTIEGGTISTAKGGVIDTVGGNGALDGQTAGAIKIIGEVSVTNGTVLSLAGVIDNTGTITDAAGVNSTQIRLNSGTVMLTGGGALTLSNSDNNLVFGNSFQDTLVNVNNVISGTGQLGDGQMTLVNESGGTINANNAPIANVSSGVLVLNCNGGVTNAGLIEDTGTAGLTILNTAIDNLGGTITATGTGAAVNLSGTVIQGGTLTTAAGGVINDVSSSALDGSQPGIGAVTNAGEIAVENGITLTLDGTINNTGTINLNSVANATELRLGTQLVTLMGGGSIALSNNVNNYIFGNASTFVLANVNNRIFGGGNLGDGQMALLNEAAGVIDGNQSTALVVDCNVGVTNAGLMEGTAAGGLEILNSVVNNTGGIIKASGSAANVSLSGSVIEGGTLTTAGGGIVNVTSNSALDGSESGIGAVANAGTLEVVNGATLTLDGTIANSGTILINSLGNATEVHLGTQLVTLTGGGAVTLTDNANNYIFGNAAVFELDNVNNKISGAGQFGNGQMQLLNGGTIDASGTSALVVNLGNYSGTNSASGLMEATGAGGLVFTSGIFSNAGTVAANGGSVTFQSGVFNLNSANGTLTGGTWEASGAGTLAITGGAIVVDAAALSVSGPSAVLEAGNGSTETALGASLTTIAATGELSVLDKATLTIAAHTLGDSGSVALSSSGTLAVKTLAIGSTGQLTGAGELKGTASDAGTITASGGTLDITGAVSGTGVLMIDKGANAEIGGALTAASTVFAAGGTGTLTLDDPGGATTIISGFATGDVIDLAKTAATTLSYSGSTSSGVLTVKNGSAIVSTLRFTGDYKTASFKLSADGNSGTKITETGAATPFLAGSGPGGHTLSELALPAHAGLADFAPAIASGHGGFGPHESGGENFLSAFHFVSAGGPIDLMLPLHFGQ